MSETAAAVILNADRHVVLLSSEWVEKVLLKQALWTRATTHVEALMGGQLSGSKLAYKNKVKCNRNLNLI